MWYVCFITHSIFCPFGGLLGVSGTSITGTTLPFTPGHWLLDVRDHCGVLAPPLVSERARGIWQQRCLSWLCDVSLVNAKAEKEGTTSFRRKFFCLKNPTIGARFTTGVSQAISLAENRITEPSTYNLKLKLRLTLSRSQMCDVIFISIGDAMFLTVFPVCFGKQLQHFQP